MFVDHYNHFTLTELLLINTLFSLGIIKIMNHYFTIITEEDEIYQNEIIDHNHEIKDYLFQFNHQNVKINKFFSEIMSNTTSDNRSQLYHHNYTNSDVDSDIESIKSVEIENYPDPCTSWIPEIDRCQNH